MDRTSNSKSKERKIDEKSFCYVISMLGEEIIIKVLAPSVFQLLWR